MTTSDYKDKVALVRDSSGWYLSLAIKLGESFKQVWYFNNWASASPSSNPMLIGEGLEKLNVYKADYLWDKVREKKEDGTPLIDIFIYPDIYFHDEQFLLEDMGRRVFGSRNGDELEIYRWASHKHLMKLGLPQPESKLIDGLEKLREYCKDPKNDDTWIKISFTRRDSETWHHINYACSRQKLDGYAYHLGSKQYIMKWIATKAIDDAVEWGIDTTCIDGQYPKHCMVGEEFKDAAYFCKIVEYDKLPPELTDITNSLSEDFKKYRYRNTFSTECRIQGKGKSFAVDLTARGGIPPYEIQIELITNLPDIIWKGSEGECIDWKYEFEYAVQVTIMAPEAAKEEQCIQFPEKLRKFIKLRSFYIDENGDNQIIPSDLELIHVGAVLGFGHTLQEAIDNCKKNAEQVVGLYIEIEIKKLDDIPAEIEKSKEVGLSVFE